MPPSSTGTLTKTGQALKLHGWQQHKNLIWKTTLEASPERKITRRMLVEKNCQRITCPECGNDRDFFEVADGVILTTRYVQNSDGSFSQDGDESQILGEIRFFCNAAREKTKKSLPLLNSKP